MEPTPPPRLDIPGLPGPGLRGCRCQEVLKKLLSLGNQKRGSVRPASLTKRLSQSFFHFLS